MATPEGLFPNTLISAEVKASFPKGYTVRALERTDFSKGFLDCLRVLTWVGDLTEEQFHERYDEMNTQGKGTYFLIVIEYEGRIVGTGSLIAEKKFIHDRGICGHIEEVSIAKDQQGKKLGQKMLAALDSVAINLGCYKTILDCGPEKEPFYVKCKYHNSGCEMSHYHEEWKDAYHRG
ncbi:Glucosamine-phosphate N-acetyltransferase-like protein [Cladophialophora chaetospira]|uniref:Glucosamine 6-phosphate N-acetyltransferase n=1 Tax=Cladophialophora chaetospira TaxID=386627 RepID=A0AA38XIT5_9EURO|nr:Glucosamine-phosphate N-acetyltransferase-like protein [Cladophialophora chaetospira]